MSARIVAFLGVSLVLVFLLAQLQITPKLDNIVMTSDGAIRGHSMPGSPSVDLAFLGIPYAAPPVGSRRWQPTAPPTSWSPSVLSGVSPGPACIGRPTPGVAIADMDEDCLRMDVYIPKREAGTSQLVPVMVYLHGGSLVEGSGMSIQSGFGAVANVTRLGVVSVAVNYRLAVLGFLSLYSTAASDSRGVGGNYGLLDCVAALKWLKHNVASFGGNPSKVLVYGQSSGGSLVFALAASPLASGLFHVGVSMSGSPRLSSTAQEAAVSWHRDVIRKSRCAAFADDDTPDPSPRRTRLLQCLQSLNKTELIDAMPTDWDAASWSFSAFSPNFRYAPLLVVDNASAVPSDYLAAYSNPHSQSPLAEGVTLVFGVTREEIDFAPANDVRGWSLNKFKNFVVEQLGQFLNASFIDRVIAAYGLSETSDPDRLDLQQLFAQIISDATIYCPNLVLADALKRRDLRQESKRNLYVYSTSQRPGQLAGFCPLQPFEQIPGYCPHYAFHAIDMFGLFMPDWNSRRPGYNRNRQDDEYSRLLALRFGELAETGAVSTWNTYDGRDSTYRVVDLAAPHEANVANLRKAQCDLWAPFYDKLALIN